MGRISPAAGHQELLMNNDQGKRNQPGSLKFPQKFDTNLYK